MTNMQALIQQTQQAYNDNEHDKALQGCKRILQDQPNQLSAILMMADTYLKTRDYKKAAFQAEKALKISSKNNIANRILGSAQIELGDIDTAIQYLEKSIQLNPKDGSAQNNLGTAYMRSGHPNKIAKTITHFGNAVICNPDRSQYIANFMNYAGAHGLSGFNHAYKIAFTLCLKHDQINHNQARSAWNAAFNNDPNFEKLSSLALREDLSELKSYLNSEEAKSVLIDAFLCLGLKRVLPATTQTELIFTNIRAALLDIVIENKGEISDELNLFLPFLAGQSWLNEFLYYQSKDEIKKLDSLQKQIEDSWSQKLDSLHTFVTIYACYRPLIDFKFSKEMADYFLNERTELNAEFLILIKEHIINRLEEIEIAKNIETIGNDISDDVSNNVRSQYEENPYPRWSNAYTGHNSISSYDAVKILVAGCGTGKQTSIIQGFYPNAKSILNIDLSRASISYAIRKSKELGFNKESVSYKQADILTLSSLNEQFDTVHCDGVLHHMRDPLEGWKVLYDLTKDGGTMHISLYSKIAREALNPVKALIKEKGLGTTASDIRELRKLLTTDEYVDLYNAMSNFGDYFSISTCRDLLFHVQEHQFTLLQIKDIANDLGLEFEGFRFKTPNTAQEYMEMFPEDEPTTNLDNWHAFEEAKPDTFRGMYQMIFKKKA